MSVRFLEEARGEFLEQISYDEEQQKGLGDQFRDPTIDDIPPIETILIEDHEPLGTGGAKGVGEPALIPTAPAILGDIRHATDGQMDEVQVLQHRLRASLAQPSLATDEALRP